MKPEAKIERAFYNGIVELDGLCYKLSPIGRRNKPDRLVVLPHYPAYFVELKRPGKGAEEAQAREHERLRARGHDVWVLDTLDKVQKHINLMARIPIDVRRGH